MWLRAAPALGYGAVHLSQRSAQIGGTENQCSGVLGGGATVWSGAINKNVTPETEVQLSLARRVRTPETGKPKEVSKVGKEAYERAEAGMRAAC